MNDNEGTETWAIYVGNYGSFLFEGTEQEAEEARRHKAKWEHGVGLKRLATIEEVASDHASQIYKDYI